MPASSTAGAPFALLRCLTLFSLCVVPFVSVRVYVLLTHKLAQSSTGYTKIFVFFFQTATFELGPLHDAFGWISVFNFSPQESSGPICISPLKYAGSSAMLCLLSRCVRFSLTFVLLFTHTARTRSCLWVSWSR